MSLAQEAQDYMKSTWNDPATFLDFIKDNDIFDEECGDVQEAGWSCVGKWTEKDLQILRDAGLEDVPEEAGNYGYHQDSYGTTTSVDSREEFVSLAEDAMQYHTDPDDDLDDKEG